MDKSNDYYINENLKHWNDRVAYHEKSDFYDVEGFKKGQTSLQSIEIEALGDMVKGKSLLHLQCHFGQDSLSWARMGAQVTGMDFSTEGINLARQLNDELGLDARFVCCNIYDLKAHLEGQFDIVFTSYGTIGWLPDLKAWASIVSHYLKPGGTFYMAEFHPTYYMVDFDSLQLTYPYFNTGVFSEPVENTYADLNAKIEGTEYFWQHPISEIMGSLMGEGLNVQEFKEFDYSPYNCFPNLVEISEGCYQVKGFEGKLPLMFSLKMGK